MTLTLPHPYDPHPSTLIPMTLTPPPSSLLQARRVFHEGSESKDGADAQYLRRWVLFERKHGYDADRTRELFQAAAALDPADTRTYLVWGQFERSKGELEVARGVFRRGLEQVRGDI